MVHRAYLHIYVPKAQSSLVHQLVQSVQFFSNELEVVDDLSALLGEVKIISQCHAMGDRGD
jgi:hypothetical protein